MKKTINLFFILFTLNINAQVLLEGGIKADTVVTIATRTSAKSSFPFLAPDDGQSNYGFVNAPNTGMSWDSDALTFRSDANIGFYTVDYPVNEVSPTGGGINFAGGQGSDGGGVSMIGGTGYISGGSFSLQGGASPLGQGGMLSIRAGNGNIGGELEMRAGNTSQEDEVGGSVNISAGIGDYGGGTILSGGTGNISGGGMVFQGGSGVLRGGNAEIKGGFSSDGLGGNVQLSPGNGAGGTFGVVLIDKLFRITPITTSQKLTISPLQNGMIINCSDCTSNDSSTGVIQVYYNGVWKNLF